MDKALEAGARALQAKYREFWPGSWPALPEAIELAKAVIAALPATDTSGLVEELRGKASPTYPTEKELRAADRIEALKREVAAKDARLAEAEAVMRDLLDACGGGGPVSQAARSYLEGRK